jgi:hypothetical protein
VRVGVEHARPGRAQAAREEAAEDRLAAAVGARRGQRPVVRREVDDVRGLRARLAGRGRGRRDGRESEEDGETRGPDPRHGVGSRLVKAAALVLRGLVGDNNIIRVGPARCVDLGFATPSFGLAAWVSNLIGEP